MVVEESKSESIHITSFAVQGNVWISLIKQDFLLHEAMLDKLLIEIWQPLFFTV